MLVIALARDGYGPVNHNVNLFFEIEQVLLVLQKNQTETRPV